MTKTKAKVTYDRHAENPLNWNDVEIHKQKKRPEGYDTVLPLYKYEHSQVAFKTSPFNSPYSGWDSGQIGWVTSDTMPENTVSSIIADEYTQWAQGRVYGITLFKIEQCEQCSHEHEEPIDSIAGIYADVYDSETLKKECERHFNTTPDETEVDVK